MSDGKTEITVTLKRSNLNCPPKVTEGWTAAALGLIEWAATAEVAFSKLWFQLQNAGVDALAREHLQVQA